MARRYDAFLVRHWALDGERGSRIEVVHVQSGDRSLGTSLAEVVTWMQARVTSSGAVDRAPPGGEPADDLIGRSSPAAGNPVAPQE
jgi:hypothetical protein